MSVTHEFMQNFLINSKIPFYSELHLRLQRDIISQLPHITAKKSPNRIHTNTFAKKPVQTNRRTPFC